MSLHADLRGHVEQLAGQPRHRAVHGSRERAQEYVEDVVGNAGWGVIHHDYSTIPSVLRTSDYGRKWWPAGAGGPIHGRNVIAYRGDPEGAIWITAHLDSVFCSPSNDQNLWMALGGVT